MIKFIGTFINFELLDKCMQINKKNNKKFKRNLSIYF